MIKDVCLEEKCIAESAGTSSWHQGERPHHFSIEIAKRYGIDLTKQRGRSIELTDNNEFDYIIPMDQSNKENLIYEFNFSPEKVIKMREFDDKSKGTDVPDPYGHQFTAFEDLYILLERCLKNLIKFLKKNHQWE